MNKDIDKVAIPSMETEDAAEDKDEKGDEDADDDEDEEESDDKPTTKNEWEKVKKEGEMATLNKLVNEEINGKGKEDSRSFLNGKVDEEKISDEVRQIVRSQVNEEIEDRVLLEVR